MKADAVYILDDTALEALWGLREGRETVEEILEQARHRNLEIYVTAVDLGRAYRAIRQVQDKKAARRALEQLEEGPINTVVVNKKIALEAIEVAAEHRLEYCSAFASALGMITAGTLVSANRELPDSLRDELDVLMLPERT